MLIPEFQPLIMGAEYTRESAPPMRCSDLSIKRAVSAANCSSKFPASIKFLEDYKEFMYIEQDIAGMAPKSEYEDLFYSLKLGGYSDAVPSRCLYTLKTLFAKYGSISIALKALTKGQVTVFFQQNYLNGVTMRDVVKSLIDPEYEPMTMARTRIKHETYDEVYIASTDMVALLPKGISNLLSDTDLQKITVDKNGLRIGSLYLRFMGGYYGATNSIYDLRGLI